MVRNRRQWTFGILFWVIFLASLWFGLGNRIAWLDEAWAIFRFAVLAVVSVIMVVAYRRGNSRGYFFARGLPRWIASCFWDDEDIEKRRRWSLRISG
jgi:hypothetical protein